jgi:hypothetical protein
VLEEAPEQPYTVIARIETKADAVFKSYDDLRAKIVDEAAQVGGEAARPECSPLRRRSWPARSSFSTDRGLWEAFPELEVCFRPVAPPTRPGRGGVLPRRDPESDPGFPGRALC